KPGKNSFAIEFTSAKDKQPVDVGKVSLSTSMAMTGMAPMIAGATVSPDKAPGRYLGSIDFPDPGTRQVTVTWEGPAGNGSVKFAVPVRYGHDALRGPCPGRSARACRGGGAISACAVTTNRPRHRRGAGGAPDRRETGDP